MSITSQEIIKSLQREFSEQYQVKIKNCTDLNIQINRKYAIQYIIGFTEGYGHSYDLDAYKASMEKLLADSRSEIKCFAWPFQVDELEEVRGVLNDLAEHFDIQIDLDTMIGRLEIKPTQNRQFYIVVTVVNYPVIYVE